MPNHIINIISINEDWESKDDRGSDFEEIAEAVKGTDSDFDFNKIIPMPEDIERGDISFEKMKETKGRNWYDWSIENWGTKWNAYSTRIDRWGKIVFQTAWAHPFAIIKKLSQMFPKNTFNVGYADEDKGSNLGLYKMKNGKILHQLDLPEKYNDDTVLLAEIMWGADKFDPIPNKNDSKN